ncbi:protein windpipe [Eupeodes corollae]|uniref:protein windpipe n=1 Tax=Eupeodes corollae TaxID=290404 RepID=UPI0024923BA4|nr:protein windpipe [Eupeodes corollae]XP_055916732.1 protein windpipe [Eupeodes corollae]XP_055916733.1 protein windpipe [Eupeodes corollae]XP_055916734.1 protein windpipe [Eupeodes corollae]XP_055916735.1 protein windpipe [Eupeodes corollae]
MSQNKFNLFALLALVLVTLASTYDCPEDCQCSVINGAKPPHNYAKCSSLNGLMKSRNLPIHSIDLSGLALTRIPSHQLEKLRDLTAIDLSNNEIAEVGRLGPRVKNLNLRNNSITSGKLSKIPTHVQHLDLSHNDLTYLPLELRNLSNLRTIELNNNKINCSCETLEVRNWLQEQHVYTKSVVKCAYPSEVKGKPWLQVKQSQMCDREKASLGFDENEDDNELMMGDAPADDGSGDEEDDANEAELGKVFMPVDDKKPPTTESSNPKDEVEGSGDEHERHLAEEKEDGIFDNDDGSGSGMGPMLNIFKLNDDESQEGTPVTEDEIVPLVMKPVEGAESPEEKDSTEAAENGNDIQKASIMVPRDENEESKNTYVLLGVILLIVLGLILYVGIKRCKTNSRNRANDAENPRSTELLNMDKKNLGKPIQKNGMEHAPLITEKKKEEIVKPVNGNSRTVYEDEKDKKTHEPLLNGDSKPQNESNNNVLPPTTEEPSQPTIRQPEYTEPPYDPNHRIIPRYPPPKSPRASKQNYQNDDDPYLPSSPRMGRYSPVYSPETGKVKIKLTETPRPKTPMLVTRSKSNAGDIITTPVVRSRTSAAPEGEVGLHARTESPQTHTQENLQNHMKEQQQ